MALAVGDLAPEFSLDGVDGATGERGRWSRSDFLGAPLVVVFYPGDNTAVCTAQLLEYTQGIGQLDELGAKVVAISPQSVDSHAEFAAAQDGFAFPLLADPGKAVGREWGILGLLDLYRRSTFVLDAEGRVTWAHRYFGMGLAFKPLETLVAAVVDPAADPHAVPE